MCTHVFCDYSCERRLHNHSNLGHTCNIGMETFVFAFIGVLLLLLTCSLYRKMEKLNRDTVRASFLIVVLISVVVMSACKRLIPKTRVDIFRVVWGMVGNYGELQRPTVDLREAGIVTTRTKE